MTDFFWAGNRHELNVREIINMRQKWAKTIHQNNDVPQLLVNIETHYTYEMDLNFLLVPVRNDKF